MKAHLHRLHSDQSGIAGVDMILMIAALVIPIVVVAALFGEDIANWLSDSSGKPADAGGKIKYSGSAGG